MSLPNSASKSEFIKLFNPLARHKHRYTVFSDFVTVSAISIHNALNKLPELEDEYMKIIGTYTKEEAIQLSHLLALLIDLLEAEPRDVLGQLYMELDLVTLTRGSFLPLIVFLNSWLK